jgi:cytosine/adenosine deaminase-related metal-dependent hydrolase
VRLLLTNAWVVTMDDARTEHRRGWVLVEDGLIAAVGGGDPPASVVGAAAAGAGRRREAGAEGAVDPQSTAGPPPRVGSEPPATRHHSRPFEGAGTRRPLQKNSDDFSTAARWDAAGGDTASGHAADGDAAHGGAAPEGAGAGGTAAAGVPTETRDLLGAVVTPGLVNTHHHLFQTLTRARAQEADLFTWLRTLYPLWAGIDAEMEYAAARTGLAELALSGCSTVFDHHYLFPRGATGLIEAELQAARELGLRLVASRGSMDLGVSDGGLPPDELAEDMDAVLADTERLAGLADGDLLQLAAAPCSPFSVTTRLMEESAALARRLGLRLHTHLAETVEEDTYCRELYGCTPVEYLERVGWLGADVWCAHCVHLSPEDVATFARHGIGVAHCPTSNLRLGAGVAPVRELVDAGAPVGLGVDGTASNERGDLILEVKQALLVARGRGGGTAMTARDALRLGTRGGAAVLGRDDIGSIAPGKRADLAIWRTDGLELGGAEDLVAGLVLSAPHRVDTLLVGGREVVRGGALVNADEREIAREHRTQAVRLGDDA